MKCQGLKRAQAECSRVDSWSVVPDIGDTHRHQVVVFLYPRQPEQTNNNVSNLKSNFIFKNVFLWRFKQI